MKVPGGQNGIPVSLFSKAFYFAVLLFIPSLILTHISPPPCVFESPEHAAHNHNSFHKLGASFLTGLYLTAQ
jgi:hypothetical protein